MESLDSVNFLKSLHPFDILEKDEFQKVTSNIDILYFKEEETVIKKGENPEYFYIIAKGAIKEEDNDFIYSTKDSFDITSILEKKAKNSFFAIKESLLFGLKKEIFLDIIKSNLEFESYYLQDISNKINTLLNQNSNKELSSFMVAKVNEIYLHKSIIINKNLSIYEAVETMEREKVNSLLVELENEYGIVTDSDFRRKVILNKIPYESLVSSIATPNIISIDSEEFLFNALLLMTEHNVKRLVVKEGEKILGILEQIDLISAFSNRAHLVNVQINKAKNIEELQNAIKDIYLLVKALQAKGVKVRHINKLVSEINIKIYKKVYELIMPKEVIENSALIVMGSEGRKEQTLKTDQDNAIIIKDGFEYKMQELNSKFTETLLKLGFPKCDGNIMVSNPYWAKTFSEYKKEIINYINTPNPENLMNLAIIFDSSFVIGDKELFKELKNFIFENLEDNFSLFLYFARATIQFETPISIFANFVLDKSHNNEIDIKKGAIFPIVHGIRSLALEKKISKTNTIDRIKELNNLGFIEREFASDLIESFSFLLSLRLKFMIEKIDNLETADNYINPQKLNKIEKDLLKDVFKVVDRFKKFISFHFKLSSL
jgi:CBS domain-containing protein